MRFPLGFGGVILHYNHFRYLGLNRMRFRLSNPFLQFCNGPTGRGSGSGVYITKGKVRNQGGIQRTECKKQ